MRLEEPEFLMGYFGKEGSESVSLGIVDTVTGLILENKSQRPECSLEGLILKLKLQYFDHLMQRADSFEKNQMLAKIEGRKRRGQQRMRWLDASPTQCTLNKLCR